VSDAQARLELFSSAQDKVDTNKAFAKYLPDIAGHGRMNDWEYRLAQDTFSHGSLAAQMRMVVAFDYLQGDPERRKALAFLPSGTIRNELYDMWRSAARRWIMSSKRPAVLDLLMSTGNPNAINIANDLRETPSAQS
jgi:hypothetical protein